MPPLPPLAPAAASSAPSGERVLLVDDDELILKALSRILEEAQSIVKDALTEGGILLAQPESFPRSILVANRP